MFMLNGNRLQLDTIFEIDGTTYPANWLRLSSPEEKEAIGITEVPDPEPYDDRFYWGHDNPKDLDQLKKQWTQWVDDTVWLMLQKTDWMDSRKANDPKYQAPADWLAWRSAIRAQGKSTKEAIAAAADVPSLKDTISVQWALDPVAQSFVQTEETN